MFRERWEPKERFFWFNTRFLFEMFKVVLVPNNILQQ